MGLDPAQDPDRFDPDREPVDVGPLDPALDPDRFDRTLPQLLGKGAYEEPREGMEWLVGLLGVIGFLVVVSLVISLL